MRKYHFSFCINPQRSLEEDSLPRYTYSVKQQSVLLLLLISFFTTEPYGELRWWLWISVMRILHLGTDVSLSFKRASCICLHWTVLIRVGDEVFLASFIFNFFYSQAHQTRVVKRVGQQRRSDILLRLFFWRWLEVLCKTIFLRDHLGELHTRRKLWCISTAGKLYTEFYFRGEAVWGKVMRATQIQKVHNVINYLTRTPLKSNINGVDHSYALNVIQTYLQNSSFWLARVSLFKLFIRMLQYLTIALYQCSTICWL